MSLHWPAKAPGDTREYRWALGDAVASVSVTVTGTATATAKPDGQDALITVAGGALGVVQVLALAATLSSGEIVTQTAYVPILATAQSFAYTGRSIAEFALRKVVGIGETPDADQMADALERLSDMLAAWKGQGADIGVALPVGASDTLPISDAFASAVKYNLLLACIGLYGANEYQPSPFEVEAARRGLQQVKMTLLTGDRTLAAYF